MLESVARKHQLQIKLEIPADLPPLLLPQNEVIQVLYNLIQNAIQASPRQGEIILRAERVDDTIHLQVTDFGAGIPPEVLPHIFEPFFTTKQEEEEGGMGLGLAVSHSLVSAMGGRLEVDTTVGQGTTFTLVLPCTTPDTQERRQGWRT